MCSKVIDRVPHAKLQRWGGIPPWIPHTLNARRCRSARSCGMVQGAALLLAPRGRAAAGAADIPVTTTLKMRCTDRQRADQSMAQQSLGKPRLKLNSHGVRGSRVGVSGAPRRCCRAGRPSARARTELVSRPSSGAAHAPLCAPPSGAPCRMRRWCCWTAPTRRPRSTGRWAPPPDPQRRPAPRRLLGARSCLSPGETLVRWGMQRSARLFKVPLM